MLKKIRIALLATCLALALAPAQAGVLDADEEWSQTTSAARNVVSAAQAPLGPQAYSPTTTGQYNGANTHGMMSSAAGGNSNQSASPIPEPGTFLLAVLGALMLFASRKIGRSK